MKNERINRAINPPPRNALIQRSGNEVNEVRFFQMDCGKELAQARGENDHMREVDIRAIKRVESWAENVRNIAPKCNQ